MDELPSLLAREAQALGLNALNVMDAPQDAVLAFAQRTLEELAARGLVPGDPDVGCWAARRSAAH